MTATLHTVSVVLPTYNRANLISRTIDSVLAQTFDDFEFLILDDGSTDNTEDVVRSYDDPRIRYIKQDRNRGLVTGVNKLLDLVKGRYIARIDSDDIWYPDKLQIQYSYMEEHPEIGACFTGLNLIDDQGNICDERYPDALAVFRHDLKDRRAQMHHLFTKGNFLCNPTAFIRTECQRTVGYANPIFWICGDYEYWHRFISRFPIAVLPQKLVGYRWSPDSDQLSNHDTESERVAILLASEVRRQFFDFMSDADFVSWFHDDFRNPDSFSELELRCEKAFLHLDHPFNSIPMDIIGLQKLDELIKIPEAQQLLEERFDFCCRDLYALRLSSRLPENIDYKKELALSRQHSDNLEVLLQNIQNSGAYRFANKLTSLKNKLMN